MITMITGLIGGLLYPLFSVIFWVIDLLQYIFYALAGIGDIQVRYNSFGANKNYNITANNTGKETDTGLIYYLLTSDLIKNLFMSILVLALILIIIFTAMAFIKNAYSSKPKNWQEIVGNAFKGLANFIFIPVCCLLGVWLSNILLIAINGATSTGGATLMSRKLFICCAYDANSYRIGSKKVADDDDFNELKNLIENNYCQVWDNEGNKYVYKSLSTLITLENKGFEDDAQEYYAQIVDQVFAESTIDIHGYVNVERYYSLFNFNYVILIVGGVFMLYVLVSLAYAMIKRMFILLMLFVISPALCAMYPLDEGAAVGNWKKEFIKYTISAYGSVVGMNLFFSILPIVKTINIISVGGTFTNEIFQLLIMVSGLYVVKEFMGTLSGWIGGDNALATGESLRSSTKKAIKDKATAATKKTAGAFTTAGRLHAAFKDAKGDTKGFKGFLKGAGGELREGLNMGLTSMDKHGLNIKETFGLGYNDKGEKQTNAWAAGGKAFKDKKKGIKNYQLSEEIKKDDKAARESFKAGNFLTNHATAEDGSTYTTNEQMALLDKEMTRLGFDENEKLQKMKTAGGYSSFRDLKDAVANGNKELDKRKEKERKDESVAESSAANAELAKAIAEALGGSSGGPSGPTGASPTPSGAESRVEATVRERMENTLQKQTNELLEKLISIDQESKNKSFDSSVEDLMKFNPGGDNSAFAELIKKHVDNGQTITAKQVVGNVAIDGDMDKFASALGRYNSSLEAKKNAEQQAKEVTDQFVAEMKKSAEVEKALSGLDKEIGRTEEELRKLAKTVEDIAKRSK